MSHFINGQWFDGEGEPFTSRDPATGREVWTGRSATAEQVDAAVQGARVAASTWSDTSVAERIEYLQAFSEQLKLRRNELAQTISLETGKPRWEASTEVSSMISKIDISAQAYDDRCAEVARDLNVAKGVTRFKPHGVVAVLGPFNFPGHVPNGHIVPALLAGNTVVFKPSEKTPAVAAKTIEAWHAATLPRGVLNLIQGLAPTAVSLAHHSEVDGLFFTGSRQVGLSLRQAFLDKPGKILALELGGNNPLIVHEPDDVETAAYMAVQSAFLTAGQRCTCARRLIISRDVQGERFLEQLVKLIRRVCVGPSTAEPEPFMGPVIDKKAARRVLHAQADLVGKGGRVIVETKTIGGCDAMLSPGLIDVTAIEPRADEEIFGPLLQMIRVDSFEHAIQEANQTSYGLVAGLLSGRMERYKQFHRRVRAGLVNWNLPTTGASSFLPFGGIGDSGNHRPAGYFAADYCSYPVASMESPTLVRPEDPCPGLPGFKA